jgi:prevent-host-death family protein
MKNSYSLSEFKTKTLELLDRIVESGESVVVTKRGKPVVRVVPVHDSSQVLQPDLLKNTLIGLGDIISPFGAKLWRAASPRK